MKKFLMIVGLTSLISGHAAASLATDAHALLQNLSETELNTLVEHIQQADQEKLLTLINQNISEENNAQLSNFAIGSMIVLAIGLGIHIFSDQICNGFILSLDSHFFNCTTTPEKCGFYIDKVLWLLNETCNAAL
ncbi:hypothetical protein K2W90_00190 [Candidatus Babeliales bacterium]|nr:hypothetical protein [Candidatus Babeliales bacterium]